MNSGKIMCHLRVIKHQDILFSDILKIIDIKSKAWPYSLDRQLLWIVDNIQGNDLHLILTEGEKDVAYMDMVAVKLKVGDRDLDVYGIGNVCSIQKGKGYGKELMIRANKYLVDKNKIGVLFCRIPLVDFYQKYGWSLIAPNNVKLDFCDDGIKMMVFNVDLSKNEVVAYRDRMF